MAHDAPTQANESTKSSETPMRDLPTKLATAAMARLWRRMGAIYGMGRWLEHAPESVMDDWQDLLGARTLADIARGIAKVEAEPGKFPPGAADFRRLCGEFQPGTFAGGAPKALPEMPNVVQMLAGASVSGDARAYLDMCERLTAGKRLTRAELETLPALRTSGGEVIRPRDFCLAAEDEEATA